MRPRISIRGRVCPSVRPSVRVVFERRKLLFLRLKRLQMTNNNINNDVPSRYLFLDATTHLYKRSCPSVCLSVCLYVCLSVCWSDTLSNSPRIVALSVRGPQIKVQDQSMNHLLSQSLTQSFIYKTGRIFGICWPCFCLDYRHSE